MEYFFSTQAINKTKQPGVTYSDSTLSTSQPPVYGETTAQIHRQPRLTPFLRLFMPELPSKVTKSLETVSLSPTDAGWEFVEWDTSQIEDVGEFTGYTFTPEQKLTLLSIMQMLRWMSPSNGHCAPSVSTAIEPEDDKQIVTELPSQRLTLAVPTFPRAINKAEYSWSPTLAMSTRYLPREQKWSNTPTLDAGLYQVQAIINFDGAYPMNFDISDTKGVSLGIVTMDIMASIKFDFCVDTSIPFLVQCKANTNQRTGICITLLISKAEKHYVLGKTTPIWVTDHQLNRRKEDLTTEGIEPNPGPMFLDLWVAKAKTNPDWLVVLATLDTLTDNKFNALAAIDFKTVDDSDWDVALQPESESSSGEKPKLKAKVDKTTIPQKEYTGAKPKSTSIIDASLARRAAVLRIANRLSDELYATSFVARLPTIKRSLVRLIANTAWGIGWESLKKMSAIQFSLYSWINNVNVEEWASNIIDTTKDKTSENWAILRESLADINATGYVEASARVHNKLVHSLNGNIFSATMQEVDQATDFWPLMTAPPAGTPYMPMANKNIILAGVSSSNINYTSGKDCGGLASDVITNQGIVVQNQKINYPCSALQLLRTLQACKLSGEESYYVDMVTRKNGVSILTARMVDYWANTLTPTEFSTIINNEIRQRGYYRTRETDMAQTGFASQDLVTVNGMLDCQGFSFERMLVVLLMQHSAINHSQYDDIPNSCFTSGSDYIVNGSPELLKFKWAIGMEDQFDYDQAIFPFLNIPGTLTFHLSMATVPNSAVDNVLFIPSFLAEANLLLQKGMALAIMGVAEYPFTIAGWEAYERAEDLDDPVPWHIPPTSDKSKLTQWAQQIFDKFTDKGKRTAIWLLNHSTVRIPGMTDIHVILPRRQSSRIPKSAGEANIVADILPIWGPNATTPSANIPITYEGQAALPSISLCQYLYSWVDDISTVDITQFLTTLHTNYDINQASTSAWDIVVSTIQRFPPLFNNQKTPPKTWSNPYEITESSSQQVSNVSSATELRSKGGGKPKYQFTTEYAISSDSNSAATISTEETAQTGEDSNISIKDESTKADVIVSFADIIHTDASVLYTPLLTKTSTAIIDSEDHDPTDHFGYAYKKYINDATHVLTNFNVQGWNKLVLGLATSDEFKPGGLFLIVPYLNDPMSIHGEIHRATQIATPMQLFTQDVGATSVFYQGARSDPTYPDLRATINALFLAESVQRLMVPPLAMPAMNSVHSAIFSCKPHARAHKTPNGLAEISVYGRWYFAPMAQIWLDNRPQTKESEVKKTDSMATPSTMFTPAILPDIWLQIFADKLPKGAMSFPVPYGLNGPAGYSNNMEMMRFTNRTNSSRVNKTLNTGVFPTDSLPEVTDESKWNIRLLVKANLGNYNFRCIDEIIPDNEYDNSRLPCSIKHAQSPFSDFDTPWDYLESSTCIPVLNDDGRRIYAVINQNLMQHISRVELRLSRLQFPVWIIGTPQIHNNVISDESGVLSRFAKVFRLGASDAQSGTPEVAPIQVPTPPHQEEELVDQTAVSHTQAPTPASEAVANP